MSAKQLKKLLQETDATIVDVAAATKVSPSTIDRYLKGATVNRSTEALLEQWVKQHSKVIEPDAKLATG